ncbi:MAG: hypothetical protein LLF75_08390 [Eubacteriales bacterium]|nr:hypothetical protein [Eubacteriales bacterium]
MLLTKQFLKKAILRSSKNIKNTRPKIPLILSPAFAEIKNTRPKIPLETGNHFDLSRGTTQLAFEKTPLVRLQQALCLYAATTENPISEKPFQVFGSEGMGLLNLPAAGIPPSPTLLMRRVRPSSSQPFVPYEIVSILPASALFVNR